jgi:hypothetical protein
MYDHEKDSKLTLLSLLWLRRFSLLFFYKRFFHHHHDVIYIMESRLFVAIVIAQGNKKQHAVALLKHWIVKP